MTDDKRFLDFLEKKQNVSDSRNTKEVFGKMEKALGYYPTVKQQKWAEKNVPLGYGGFDIGYRRFSKTYTTYPQWQQKQNKETKYYKRISSYMRKYPNSTLKQARGHTKK